MTFIRNRMIFAGTLLVVSLAALVQSTDFTQIARYMPSAVAGLTAFLSLVILVVEALRWRTWRKLDPGELPSGPEVMDNSARDGEEAPVSEVARFLLWWGAFILVMALVGARAAVVVFLTAFLRTQAGFPWIRIIFALVIVLGLLEFFGLTFGLAMPPSLVFGRSPT